MFDRIKALFAAEAETAAAPARDDDVVFAAAALLVVAAHQDGLFDGAERTRIETLLKEHFGLDGAEARALVDEAEVRVAELVRSCRSPAPSRTVSPRNSASKWLKCCGKWFTRTACSTIMRRP